MTALFLLCLALVALLAYREWGAVRERREAATDRVQLAALVDEERRQMAEERQEAARERRELYQRIQAPEIAVHDAQLERRRERPYRRREPIGADDDAALIGRAKEGEASG